MITKAYLLAQLNSRLERAETNIDAILETVLDELTLKIPALQKTVTISTTIGRADYDESTEQIRGIDTVTIDGVPIDQISYEEYLDESADEQESEWNEPERYAFHNESIYLTPTPNAIYTARVYCSSIGIATTDINLPKYYKEYLCRALCAQYCISINLLDEAAPWLALTEVSLASITNVRSKSLRKKMGYKDIG